MKHMLRICSVAFLEDSTRENNPKIDTQTWVYLKEIYGLRKKEESYQREEIGKTQEQQCFGCLC